MVAGKLDEISFALGQLKAEVGSVAQSIEANRKIADCRHLDNTDRLTKIEQTLAPLHETVNKISPIVDGIQITRWKMIGAITMVGFILATIGWIITLFAGKMLAWLTSIMR